MTFLYPNVLYALILPALLAAAAWWLWRRRSRKWEVLVSPDYRHELVHAPASWHRVLPVIFSVLAAVFCILSIARPIDGYTEVKEVPKSRNILIAIDCSRSMLSKDASPSRLGRAKTAAYDLLDALPGDNFGIIIFSGESVLLMPLTHDHNALKETIEQLQFGWVSQGGTNLEKVVRLALQTFKRDKEADSKNALVILSDGEDTVNVTYKTAEAARQSKLIIVTAGIGTTIGTTIPDENSPSGLYRDRRGQHVVSRLNPDSLQYLANQTDGQYVQLSDGAALNRFVKDIAERLDVTEGKEETRRIPNDRYIIFAVPALICLILTLIAGTRWRSFRRSSRRGMALLAGTVLLCTGLLGTEARADTAMLDNVTDLIRTGKTEEAVKAIDGMIALPDLPEETRQALEFAKGCLEQKAGNPKEAAEAFSQALLSPNRSLQSDSHFNLGNMEAAKAKTSMTFSRSEEKQTPPQPASIDDQIKEIDARLAKIPEAKQHIKEAVKRFDDALSAHRSHEGAAANKEEMLRYDKELDEYRKQLEELKKKLEEEKKKQQQQQNKDQQNKDQQNKDQQNKDQQNKDQQNKDQQNKDQQNKDQQNKDQQNKDQQNKDQQNKDQQNKEQQNKDQQNKDQQNKDQQNKDQQNKDQQNKDQQNKDQQNKDQQNTPGSQDKNKQDEMKNTPLPSSPEKDKLPEAPASSTSQPQPTGEDGKPVPVAAQKESKEAKERREARAILMERRDIEPGCPVPQRSPDYPPDKDY
ncbi:VWA domain-containing protein [Akkermansia sp. BIOML-A55]|uniref:vWA domain-containing protein n=1 Tax=Akkermansia sp. BIOML-A55 TaxID=2584611 RepID=UPI00122FAF46|nr:VWA domain-containing protein [Akkermansia sp. BIOML-A55]KAA3182686.1 VWA domain-containing protein [Akkermansia sp. BIOML-A55]